MLGNDGGEGHFVPDRLPVPAAVLGLQAVVVDWEAWQAQLVRKPCWYGC